MRAYFAAPLFTLAERQFNAQLAALLERMLWMQDVAFKPVLPQDRAAEFLPDLARVVADCLEQVRQCDVVIACLDGDDVDSGTALEVGVAYALGKPIIGYRTDFRGSEADGVNAMLRYVPTHYILTCSAIEGIEPLAEKIVAALKTLDL